MVMSCWCSLCSMTLRTWVMRMLKWRSANGVPGLDPLVVCRICSTPCTETHVLLKESLRICLDLSGASKSSVVWCGVCRVMSLSVESKAAITSTKRHAVDMPCFLRSLCVVVMMCDAKSVPLLGTPPQALGLAFSKKAGISSFL